MSTGYQNHNTASHSLLEKMMEYFMKKVMACLQNYDGHLTEILCPTLSQQFSLQFNNTIRIFN
ncbi:hypothetical protein DOY81_008213 [Sarcophaga bullata]|nr:hypothetical protein DOY81_008213 [Sarcophaga bullata]